MNELMMRQMCEEDMRGVGDLLLRPLMSAAVVERIDSEPEFAAAWEALVNPEQGLPQRGLRRRRP